MGRLEEILMWVAGVAAVGWLVFLCLFGDLPTPIFKSKKQRAEAEAEGERAEAELSAFRTAFLSAFLLAIQSNIGGYRDAVQHIAQCGHSGDVLFGALAGADKEFSRKVLDSAVAELSALGHEVAPSMLRYASGYMRSRASEFHTGVGEAACIVYYGKRLEDCPFELASSIDQAAYDAEKTVVASSL